MGHKGEDSWAGCLPSPLNPNLHHPSHNSLAQSAEGAQPLRDRMAVCMVLLP